MVAQPAEPTLHPGLDFPHGSRRRGAAREIQLLEGWRGFLVDKFLVGKDLAAAVGGEE